MTSNPVKWKTAGITLELAEYQSPILFENDHTIDEIKEIIEYNLLLCRSRDCQETCHLYREDKDAVYDNPCSLMKSVMNNFIETTSNFVAYDNKAHVENYLNSLVSLMYFLKLSEEWKGILVSDWANWAYRSMHPRIHESNATQAMWFMSKFLRNYRWMKKEVRKEFVLFVEGDSEEKFLTDFPETKDEYGPIDLNRFIDGFGFHEIPLCNVTNIRGKDKLQNLKLLLQRTREDIGGFFFIFDNDENIMDYRDNLVQEGLAKEDHFIIWDKDFEDAFPPKLIYDSIVKLCSSLPFTFGELEEEISADNKITKSIEKLYYKKISNSFDYDKIKTRVIIEAAHNLPKNYDGELIKKLKKLDDIMKTESDRYYYKNPSYGLKYEKS